MTTNTNNITMQSTQMKNETKDRKKKSTSMDGGELLTASTGLQNFSFDQLDGMDASSSCLSKAARRGSLFTTTTAATTTTTTRTEQKPQEATFLPFQQRWGYSLDCQSMDNCGSNRSSITSRGSNQPNSASCTTDADERELATRQGDAQSNVQKLYEERKDHIQELFQESWFISVDLVDDHEGHSADLSIEGSMAAEMGMAAQLAL